MTRKDLDHLTYRVIGCAIEVHKCLGPGLLESAYTPCFSKEMDIQQINHKSQLLVPLNYKGLLLESAFRLDHVVEEVLIVELKCVEKILPVHESQLLTYMKLLKIPKGLLINFNCRNIIEEGKKTMVNELYSLLP